MELNKTKYYRKNRGKTNFKLMNKKKTLEFDDILTNNCGTNIEIKVNANIVIPYKLGYN
mgnify:CR=1 FL=1